MSDKLKKEEPKRLQTYVTYDHKDIIKNIKLSTIYITSLQGIIHNLILDDENTILTIGDTFKKFDEIALMAKKKEEDNSYVPENPPELTKWEADLYCLYSILQTLKWHAGEQGLENVQETNVDEDDFKTVVEKMKKGVDTTEDMLKLQSMMTKGSS
jgi:hypothetical protein